MIRIIDEGKIPKERRWSLGKDNYEDITPDIIVEDPVGKDLVPFIYGGYIYSPGMLSRDRKYAICSKTPVNIQDINCDFTDSITCPYCGHKLTDSWEMPDSSDEEICDYCHSKYSYERDVEVTYNSVKIEKAKLVEIKKG